MPKLQVVARFYDNAFGRMYYEDELAEVPVDVLDRFRELGIVGGERPKAIVLDAPAPQAGRRGPRLSAPTGEPGSTAEA